MADNDLALATDQGAVGSGPPQAPPAPARALDKPAQERAEGVCTAVGAPLNRDRAIAQEQVFNGHEERDQVPWL